MKKIFLMLALSFPFLLFAQKDFVVAANESRILTPAERTLSIKNLKLGDNCTITIPLTMDGWTVTATDVTIGKNVHIYAAHKVRDDGALLSTPPPPPAAPNCQPGIKGTSGRDGINGPNGKNVSLNLRIRSIGSLEIEVFGDFGWHGGRGGPGGKGGNATCTCNAGQGGDGGNGGHGGNGGNGGNVTIVYSTIGNAEVSNSNFIIRNDGGIPGEGGFGPLGGAGGDGITCPDSKEPARPAGPAGRQGYNPSRGEPGRRGTVSITSK